MLVASAALGAMLPNSARSSVWTDACLAAFLLALFGLVVRYWAARWHQRSAHYRGLARRGGLKQAAKAAGDASAGAVAGGAHPLDKP